RSWRKAWAAAAAALSRTRIGSCAVAIDLPDARQLDDYYFGRSVAELAGAALYRIKDLKTGKKPPLPELKRVLAGPVRRAAAAALHRARVSWDGRAAAAGRAGRQGRYVRFRRHLPLGPAGHG